MIEEIYFKYDYFRHESMRKLPIKQQIKWNDKIKVDRNYFNVR